MSPATPAQLELLFQHVLDNAVKFTESPPPDVKLTAERTETGWCICCRDRGIGIEAELVDDAFGLFAQLNPRDKYPGIGMGLTLSKRVVERHGGRIWLESSAREGTRVYFTLLDVPTGSPDRT